MEAMKEEDLIKLGFVNTSYIDQNGDYFLQYTFKHENGVMITVSRLNYTKNETWITVPNCKNITDVTKLIELFKLPF
jgi:hypothetical protein